MRDSSTCNVGMPPDYLNHNSGIWHEIWCDRAWCAHMFPCAQYLTMIEVQEIKGINEKIDMKRIDSLLRAVTMHSMRSLPGGWLSQLSTVPVPVCRVNCWSDWLRNTGTMILIMLLWRIPAIVLFHLEQQIYEQRVAAARGRRLSLERKLETGQSLILKGCLHMASFASWMLSSHCKYIILKYKLFKVIQPGVDFRLVQ